MQRYFTPECRRVGLLTPEVMPHYFRKTTHLMSKCNELKLQGSAATKSKGEDGGNGGKICYHACDRTALAQKSSDFLGLSKF
jgi:hypothetical protein